MMSKIEARDSFFAGREPRSRDLNRCIRDAFSDSWDLLDSPEGREAVALIPSIRRVKKVFGDEIEQLVLSRTDDILYDATSFAHLGLDHASVKRGLQTIQALEACYYPVAALRASMIPVKERIADEGWSIFIAQQIVRDVIWDRWIPRGETTGERCASLYRSLAANLRYIKHQTFRDFSSSEGSLILPYDEWMDALVPGVMSTTTEHIVFSRLSDEYNTEGDGHLEISYDSMTTPRNLRFERVLDEIRAMIQPFTLQEVFAMIAKLEVREKQEVLKRFGYYLPDISYIEFYRVRKMSKATGLDDLIRAAAKFRGWTSDEASPVATMPVHPISVIVAVIDERSVYRLGDRVLHFDSPRIKLVRSGCLMDHEFMNGLTRVEQQILHLALDLYQDTFIHSNKQIAERLGVSDTLVETTLTELLDVRESGQKRYIDTKDTVIRKGSAQRLLIEERAQVKPEQLAALSQLQYDLFMFLTTPNADGRYPTIAEAKKAVKYSDHELPDKILIAFRDNDKILNLKRQLELAFEHIETFTPDQQRAIRYIYDCIIKGIPIRGKTGGLGYRKLSKVLELPAHFCFNFFKYELPARLARITGETQVSIESEEKADEPSPSPRDLLQAEKDVRYAVDLKEWDLNKILDTMRSLFDLDEVKLAWGMQLNLPLLSKEEAYELVTKWQLDRDENSRSKLVQHNIRLVLYVARKKINRGIPFLDLVQEGCMGLMKAIDRLDISKGYQLSTYAMWWIRQYVGRAIDNQGSTIRLPVHMTHLLGRLLKAEREVQARYPYLDLKSETGQRMVAEILGVKIVKIAKLNSYRQTLFLEELNRPLNEDEDGKEVEDQIADTGRTVEEIAFGRYATDKLLQAIMRLNMDKRDREIFLCRCGLPDGHKYSLEEVGEMFEVTRERVRQIVQETLDKLKEMPEIIALHAHE